MTTTPNIKLVIRNYDFLAPLGCGDVVAKGMNLNFLREPDPVLVRVLADTSIDAGELSLGRHLMRLARGDHSFVALPIFPNRSFKHRCFFVRQGSGLSRFEDLQGKRIGADEWPTTGNAWSRALMRAHGVRVEEIDWWVGTIDGTFTHRPYGESPPYVRTCTDRTLMDMLMADELDALTCPFPPKCFYDKDSPIVRLYPDFQDVERQYFAQTGIFPQIHCVGMRREVYEKHPDVLLKLFDALDQSTQLWRKARRGLADTTPWMMRDLEDTIALMGEDWAPSGVEKNRKAVQTLADAQFVDGLSPRKLAPGEAFAEFESGMAAR